MTIPPVLRESWHAPEFWARYTFAHEDGPGADRLGALQDVLDAEDELDDIDDDGEEAADEDPADDDTSLDVAFEVGPGHHVVLSVDVSIDLHSLGVTTPGTAEPAELGWDDMAHWHPYALRWSELDLICRAIAASSPEQPAGLALALLCRFAAVFEDDDVDQAVAAVEEAYAALRPADWDGYWPRGTDWLERADFRGEGVTWQRDDAGDLWAVQHDADAQPFYSTRVGPDPGTDPDPGTGEGFPHAQLRAVLDAARATLGRSATDR
ncbi:hypothetical protein [Promicromonospora sp. NPDC059942]|uniref:hypothetical protein n=1 Tax=Promicromonospora sp. NPDC059942 TaxID=3347009 RepID=UPI00365A2C82